jgi:WD40 repeat protein/tetratricopeptide (TPR) repeat protein
MQHEASVMSARFSTDGTRVITTILGGPARVWEAATGQLIGTPMRHEGGVGSASFSDGTRVVTASGSDKTACVWDAATGQPDGTPIGGFVSSATFSADGKRVVTAGFGSRVWDAATGEAIGTPMRHQGLIRSARFNPEGTRVITTSHDMTARVWDTATGEPIGTPMQHESSVESASFSPDGLRVVTASFDKTARLWDAATGQPIGKPMQHQAGVNSANFSPDGLRVVTASWDATARVWDATTAQPVGAPMQHQGVVSSAKFSPDGLRVVTAGGMTACVWDAATGQAIGAPMRHKQIVSDASFSPDGLRVVTASADKAARVWDTGTGHTIGPLMQHQDMVQSVSFSPNGLRVVTVSSSTARVWDVATGQRIADGELAENLATLCAGARLHPLLGTLTPIAAEERLAAWPKLERELADRGLSDWVGVLKRFKNPPPSASCSLRSTATIREVATNLFTSGLDYRVREAASLDPGNPLLPFAFAGLEESAKDKQEANAQRARFLRTYGLARLPADAVLAAKAAEMLEKQQQAKLARQAWARAAEATPADTDAAALRALGQALRKLDRLAESLAVLQKSAQRFPKDPGSLAGLALTQWLANDRDAAVATFRRLIELNRQWAVPANITELNGNAAEQQALEAVRAETILRHPDLAPPTETKATDPATKR